MLSSPKTAVITISWWILWALLHFTVLMNYSIAAEPAVYESVIANLLLAGICAGVVYSVRFSGLTSGRLLSLIISILVVAAAWAWLTVRIQEELFSNESGYIDFLNETVILRFIVGMLIITMFMMVGQMIRIAGEKLDESNRQHEITRISREAELLNLRQQLQPHFLFNTLNSVSALAASDPERARLMIQQLADFLRGTLKKDDQQQVTLEEETEHLRLYLEIEKVRFGNRLSTRLDVDKSLYPIHIPSLCMQPLVENAIKFGLYDTLEPVEIVITASLRGNHLELSVTNPFDESSSKSVAGTGFGLTSIGRRLYLLYGRNDLISTSTVNNIFTATLKIPLQQ